MSGRDLPLDLSADIASPRLQPFLAIHIATPDPVYGFTGKGTIRFNDADWTGYEGIASVDTIGESTDGSATGVTATLYRIPTEFREDLADQAVRGVAFELYVGTFDDAFQTVRAFKRVWKGTLQTYDISDNGESLTVKVGGESRAIDQRRPAIKRFTDEYQQRKYPGDRFFEYVPRLAEVPVLWAKADQAAV